MLKLHTLGQMGHVASFDKRFDALRYGQVGNWERVPSAERRHARFGPFSWCPPVFIVPIQRSRRGKVGWFQLSVKERPDALPGTGSLGGK